MHAIGTYTTGDSTDSTPVVPAINLRRLSRYDIYSAAQRIVGQNGKKPAGWQSCETQPVLVQHPGNFGILPVPYYVLGHTK